MERSTSSRSWRKMIITTVNVAMKKLLQQVGWRTNFSILDRFHMFFSTFRFYSPTIRTWTELRLRGSLIQESLLYTRLDTGGCKNKSCLINSRPQQETWGFLETAGIVGVVVWITEEHRKRWRKRTNKTMSMASIVIPEPSSFSPLQQQKAGKQPEAIGGTVDSLSDCYVFRPIQPSDRDRVKELHEEWFPVV